MRRKITTAEARQLSSDILARAEARRADAVRQEAVADNFHAHLDGCKQCRENPFKLCARGHQLLTNPAT